MSSESITDKLDTEYAPAWRPEAAEKLVGELIAVDERLGYNDLPYPILTLRSAGVDVAVHCFHAVLRNEIGKNNPQLGEVVAIKYGGEIAKEGGRGRYHAYRVAVDRPQGAVNLEKYGDDPPVTPDVPDIPIDAPSADAAEDDGDVPF